MKILVNAATAVSGGGIQVAASFIARAAVNPCGNRFVYAVSRFVEDNLKGLLDEPPGDLFVIHPSPARFREGRGARRKLREMENFYQPDLVYSIASPSYVGFRATEVARLTNPWITHPNHYAFNILSFNEKIKYLVSYRYKLWILRNVAAFNFQTRVAAEGLKKKLNLSANKIVVIPNTYNQIFDDASNNRSVQYAPSNLITLFVLAYPYPHKNLMIIPELSFRLKQKGIKARFVTTIPKENKYLPLITNAAQQYSVSDSILNVGRLTLPECIEWYNRSDMVFLPTLLETFSATYLESMRMGRPIVTSDLDFAHDICKDAAAYFKPCSAESAADMIEKVVNDHFYRDRLVDNGFNRLKDFPGPEDQFQIMMQWLLECNKLRAG
jgi:glycosyltransferase involved in cell wall biosynthesis